MPFHPHTSHPFSWPRHTISHATSMTTLALHRLIANAGAGLIGIFFPIFLFQFFDGRIQLVLLWYLVNFLVKLPVHVWAAQTFHRIGLLTSMVIGLLGAELFFLAAYFLDIEVGNIFTLLILAIIGLAANSAFYWAPFHIDFAELTQGKHRGVQLSRFYAAQQVIGVLAPVLGGFIISAYSFNAAFFMTIVIYGLSIIPLMYMKRFKVKFEFGFWETFRKFFEKKYRPMVIAMAANGAENIVGVIIWPIFLFTVFEGRYLDLGAFAAVIIIIGFVLELLVGKQSDRKTAKRILGLSTHVYSLGWVAKALASTVVGVFAASTFHTFGSIMLRTPFNSMLYEQAADSGHYVDEFTVIRELALNIGRAAMILLLMFLMVWFSIPIAFVVAAIVSLGMTKLKQLK